MKTIDAIAITPVASQPITDHAREIVKSPSIFTLVAIRMRSAMTGTATMALTTADHTNALTGRMYRFAPACSERPPRLVSSARPSVWIS